MLAQARAESPHECCGLLAGRIAENGAHGEATHHYPLTNELKSPTEFFSEPRGMLAAVKDMRREGIDVLAVYHSHPTSPPVPSRKDLERNYSERVMNLIVGLAGESPDIRAWWLRADGYDEAQFEVTNE